MSDPGSQQRSDPVTLGGLRDQVAYDDRAFDIDPGIQQTFYGETSDTATGSFGRTWTLATIYLFDRLPIAPR